MVVPLASSSDRMAFTAKLFAPWSLLCACLLSDGIVTVMFVVLGNYFVFHGYIEELFKTRLAAVNIFIYNDI